MWSWFKRKPHYEMSRSVWDERILVQVFSSKSVKQIFEVGRIASGYVVDMRNRKRIEEACARLRSVFDIEYERGLVTVKLRSYMNYEDLRSEFRVRSVSDFMTLSSVYAQRIYRLLGSYKDGEVEIPIEKLYRKTNASESMRNDFARFRESALEVAERELKNTSLKIEWRPVRSRSVFAVRFKIGIIDGENPEKGDQIDVGR